MSDLTRDHPAVEGAAPIVRQECMGENWGRQWRDLGDQAKDNWRSRAQAILTAALPHLTADDLRHTQAGRALMAEGWEVGAATAWARTAEGFNAECAFEHCAPTGDDPYVEFREANPDVPNPYREARP